MTQPPTWPSTAASSIQALIKELRKLGKGEAKNTKVGLTTPYSLQVIKSGATSITQLWAALVAAAGGLPALLALYQSLRNDFKTTETLVRTAFVISGSVLLSTVVIAIAIIVKGDVAGRALATAAEKQAEASIVVASLTSYQYAQPTPPPIGPYLLKKKDGTVIQVESFGIANGAVEIRSGGQVVDTTDIDFMFDSRSVKV